MSVPHPIQNLKSVISRQKFGEMNGYGGEIYGVFEYGWFNFASGIYRVRHYLGKKYKEKMDFYTYVITHSEGQNVNRTKFADAVAAWQALTAEQKAVYKNRAVGRHMFGYHLFLREYMLAN
jgi:hypothetical protein